MKKTLLLLVSGLISLLAAANTGIWEKRLREMEQLGLPYFYNSDVEAAIQNWLGSGADSMATVAGKFNFYSAKVDYVARKHGLPWFIKYLPASSSGYNPKFHDKDGSQGIWSLNFTMGKKYGLRQTSLWEERNSPEKSSEAACHYLKDLHFIYKDWLKTIAAFKIGAVRLNQVIRLSGNQLEFENLYPYLNPEEKQVVVQFYAATAILHYWKETGITAGNYQLPASDTVQVMCSLPVSFFQEKTGISFQELVKLNPELKSETIPWFGEPLTLAVPSEKKVVYNQKRDSLCEDYKNRSKPPVVYDTVVRVVDSVTYIEIKPRTERSVEPVVRPRANPVPVRPATPQYVWVWYKVKPGDGLYTLSDVFDCSITQLKSWNGLRSNSLVAGRSLKFYVPASKKAFYQSINSMSLPQKRNLASRD